MIAYEFVLNELGPHVGRRLAYTGEIEVLVVEITAIGGGLDTPTIDRHAPAAVDEITLSTHAYPASDAAMLVEQDRYAAGDHRVWLHLGTPTEDQVHVALARLADSGVLPTVFGQAPAGRHVAPIADSGAVARAAAVLADILADLPSSGAMPAGWYRYREDRGGYVGTVISTCGDLAGAAARSGVIGWRMVWDPRHPDRAVIVDPDRYVARLRGLGIRPPLAEETFVVAAWTAGYSNVRVLADTVGVDRGTVYRILERNGLERP